MVKVNVYQNQSAKDLNKRVLERIVYDCPSIVLDVNKANDVLHWLYGSEAIISYEFIPDNN